MSEQLKRVTVCRHDVRVSIRHAKEATGRPLVLCNGIGASLDLLQPFVDALPASFEVVRFDVPGAGGSSQPRTPYNFPALAWFLGKLLDRLGYADVDMLGISWGGGLAQQFAFQNPKRCAHLVLVSTATGAIMVPASPLILRKMITPRRFRDPEYAVTIAAQLYGGRLRDEPELARRLLHKDSRIGSRRGYLLQLTAGAGWTSLPFLPLIRQQTLVMSGRDDPIIPSVNARIMHRLLPNARLYLFDDGHLGLITNAPDLAPIITQFIAE